MKAGKVGRRGIAFATLGAMMVIVVSYKYVESPSTASLQTNFRLPVKKVITRGFVFGRHFSDQMTGSLTNLLSLQCWAKQLDLLVVEPFAFETYLGANLTTEKGRQEKSDVRLSDMFDINEIKEYTKKKGYSPLVSWEVFLSNAPRKLILVSQPRKDDCDTMLEKFRMRTIPFAEEHNFTIVREVCFNFLVNGSEETVKSFSERILGDADPRTVTILFDYWGGILNKIGDRFRMVIRDSQCLRRVTEAVEVARTSGLIVNDTQKYIAKYLNGSPYNAVMIRFQYFFINHQLGSKSNAEQSSAIDGCLESILSKWKELNSTNYSTLLTMDFGKYGSTGKFAGPWLGEKIKHFFSSIYGTALSFEQWEDSFKSIAHKTSPAYIAQLQKELGARSHCLILAGSAGESAFQQQARSLHGSYSGSSVCNADACS